MPPAAPLLLALLRLCSITSAGALEIVDRGEPELTCSQGLTDCRISSASPYAAALPEPGDGVKVTRLRLKVVLCCSARRDCEPCLQIFITVREVERDESPSGDPSEGTGSGPPEPTELLILCLSSPGFGEFCKSLQFRAIGGGLDRQHELLLEEEVKFGVPVVVHVDTNTEQQVQNISVPPLEEVCSMNLDGVVPECDAPRLRAVTDPHRDLVLLQLEEEPDDVTRDEVMCRLVWDETPGELLLWPKGQTELLIPSSQVSPCLCFQVWWKGKSLHRKSCPFKDQPEALERMRHNVSVSVAECPARGGGSALAWNVSAPCRLEADVWLCRKEAAGGPCEEVLGSRQTLRRHGWRPTPRGHWRAGEFNTSSSPQLCVQIKIHGMKSHLQPQCPFSASRWRWSLPVLAGSLLLCLVTLGAYLAQGVLKGYMWRWLKEDDVRGALGGGQVVLLYPPEDGQAAPELMNHLGSSLHALGFSVSLDLWSAGELGALGPVPWLHSRLGRGGKVVLVLTQAAWIRAEEWGARSGGRGPAPPGPCVDVFTAALSCVLADYLQGRAGERFLLVRFESLPPEPPGGFRPLPELFRGLHVYSLPAQSLGFLTELAGAGLTGTAAARRRRAGGLRMASRVLARGLTAFTAGTGGLRLAAVSPRCVGGAGDESGETVPLQPHLDTPPPSPDAGVAWV